VCDSKHTYISLYSLSLYSLSLSLSLSLFSSPSLCICICRHFLPRLNDRSIRFRPTSNPCIGSRRRPINPPRPTAAAVRVVVATAVAPVAWTCHVGYVLLRFVCWRIFFRLFFFAFQDLVYCFKVQSFRDAKSSTHHAAAHSSSNNINCNRSNCSSGGSSNICVVSFFFS
jgi:hypothetical protein